MAFEFLETLKPKPIFQKEIIWKGAGKHNTIKGRIAENFILRIGQIVQRWDVVVGEIADSLFLGLDFMKMHHGIVNMRNMTLTLDQVTIPITKIKTENVEIYRVCHDRIKLYKDLEHPGWVKRIRNRIFNQVKYAGLCKTLFVSLHRLHRNLMELS